MDWTDIARQLTGLAHIATADAEGRPHVAVVSPAVDGERILIGVRRSSRKARNLAANPRVALMWEPGAEIYVQGTVRIIDDAAEKQQLWDRQLFSYAAAGFFGSADHPDFVYLEVRPESAAVHGHGAGGIGVTRWSRS